MKSIVKLLLLLLPMVFFFSIGSSLANTEFKDYQENKYWSKPMSWAILEGLVKGVAKPNGMYLFPNQKLTEGQFLTLLFRYGTPDLIEKYTKDTDHWYEVPYLLAEVAGIKVDKINSSKPINRGTMARYLLQAISEDDDISEKEAVMQLYKMGVAAGKRINGIAAQTYESFSPHDTLTRAEMVTFFYRLHHSAGQPLLSLDEERVENILNREKFSSLVNAYGVTLHMSKKQVEARVGEAKFISKNEYGLDWHIHYQQDWSKFVMVAYHNGKVSQFYTNQNGLAGIKRGMTKKQVLKHLGLTKELTSLPKYSATNPTQLVNYNFASNEYEIYELHDFYVTVYYDLHEKGTVSSVFVTTKAAESLKKYIYGAPSPILERAYEKQTWAILNARRVMHGVSPLEWSNSAQASSYKHSYDMAQNGYFEHTNLNGESPFDRMKTEGIDYKLAAENIAYGQVNPIHVVEAWMNSTTGHRENSLHKGLTHIGIGVYIKKEDMVPYYTQNFFTKP